MPSFRQIGCGIVLLIVLLAAALAAADLQFREVKTRLVQQVLQADPHTPIGHANELIDADPTFNRPLTGGGSLLGYLRATPSAVTCGATLGFIAPQATIKLILQPPGNPEKGNSCHDLNYFRTINCIAIAVLLLIPAICLFVLRWPDSPEPLWLLVWTGAYVAFLLHLYYGLAGILGGDLSMVTHDAVQPPRVTHPWSDSVTATWWTADVTLAWLVGLRANYAHGERSVLVLVLFASAIGSAVLLSSNGYVRVLGIALVACTVATGCYRISRYLQIPHASQRR